MQDEKRALVMELAHVLYRRNLIEVRRRRAKSKIGYYEDLKRTVQAFKGTNNRVMSLTREIRHLERRSQQMGGNVDVELKMTRESLEHELKRLANMTSGKNPPNKWMNRVSELNKQILKHKAEYMKARYDAARLTCQTRKRVARLTSLLKCTIDYQMGTAFVQAIGFKGTYDRIPHVEFEAMYREVDANKAIEKALRSNYEEKESN